jgi:dihydroorotase
MQHDLAINNGQVAISKNGQLSLSAVNLGITQGKIQEISTSPLLGTQTVDARHLHVLPGIIDSQVHFREPGLTHKEDLESGTRAAALGGVTSIFEMPNTKPPTTSREIFDEKIKLAENRAWVNYAFYVGATHDNVDQLVDLERLPGCAGIKVFIGSSTGNLLVEDDETLEKIFRQGRRRLIFHSEDEFRLRERKHLAANDVRNHHIWRDVQTAVKATERLLKLARKTGRPIHILHVTTAEETELLQKNKDIATFEITPNHLTFYAPDCYEKLGTKVQMNPPIREKHHMEALWRAVQNGNADVIGTDHAPHTLEEKQRPYPDSPSGMPGVQTVVPIMLNNVQLGKLSLFRFIELMCENPRRVFGCQGKGRIELGFDGDLTIVDLKMQKKISDQMIASKCRWTPFNGMQVSGWPRHTIVGGKTIMQDEQLLLPAQGKKVLFT